MHPTDPIEDPPIEPDAPERPEFPVFILAAPGVICLLVLALPRALAQAMRSAPATWTATLIATFGAIACFWIIAARSREQALRLPATVAIVIAIMLALRAILTMV